MRIKDESGASGALSEELKKKRDDAVAALARAHHEEECVEQLTKKYNFGRQKLVELEAKHQGKIIPLPKLSMTVSMADLKHILESEVRSWGASWGAGWGAD